MMMRLHETLIFAVKIIDFPVFDKSVTHGQTDGWTDGRTDPFRDARTYLKTRSYGKWTAVLKGKDPKAMLLGREGVATAALRIVLLAEKYS